MIACHARHAARLLAGVALALSCSGCVGAALAPLAAAGAIARSKGAERPERATAPVRETLAVRRTPAPAPQAEATAPLVTAAKGPMAVPTAPAGDNQPMVLPTSGLPAQYAQFTQFAARSAQATGNERRSAILADSTSLKPETKVCGGEQPAVVVDIDPGDATFDPAAVSATQPPLAYALMDLRRAGIAILWSSSVSQAREPDIHRALQQSGLDPLGSDALLLAARPGARKFEQVKSASEAYCIVAIAGDENSDFDDVFSYLADPAAAKDLQSLIGEGWFLAPPPIR